MARHLDNRDVLCLQIGLGVEKNTQTSPGHRICRSVVTAGCCVCCNRSQNLSFDLVLLAEMCVSCVVYFEIRACDVVAQAQWLCRVQLSQRSLKSRSMSQVRLPQELRYTESFGCVTILRYSPQ